MHYLYGALSAGLVAMLVTVLWMFLGGNTPPTIIPAFISVATGMLVTNLTRPKAVVADNQSNANSEAEPPDLLGQACVVCQRKVIVAADAMACDTCKATVHKRCSSKHSH